MITDEMIAAAADAIRKAPNYWHRENELNGTDRPHEVCRYGNVPDEPEIIVIESHYSFRDAVSAILRLVNTGRAKAAISAALSAAPPSDDYRRDAEIERLRAELEVSEAAHKAKTLMICDLRNALEPFAFEAREWSELPDSFEVDVFGVELGAIRRAIRALGEKK